MDTSGAKQPDGQDDSGSTIGTHLEACRDPDNEDVVAGILLQ